MTQSIDGRMLRDMFIAGAAQMEKHRTDVDALNVFPVPDGDTGTNMMLTVMSAAREVHGLDTAHAGRVAEAAAAGALKGARGNSGVILSQLFRGFAKAIDGNETIDGKLLATALKNGVDMAYKAIMKPKEGTILTVSRAVADGMAAALKQTEDIEMLWAQALTTGNDTLKKTPEMLPVLKQAGVVDAGGKGLLLIYAGYSMAIDGVEVTIDFGGPTGTVVPTSTGDEGIEFGYCSEMFIKNLKQGVTQGSIDHFRDKLSVFGDSIIVVGDGDLVKVHVHSNQPGKVLHMALMLGDLYDIKIDNMREQHRSLIVDAQDKPAEPRKPMGLVTVAAGEGVTELFKELSSDVVIQGGQTMNPSIDDIAKAIERCNAEHVYILPNNSNIIMAAQQAAALAEDADVRVLTTKSVPQGVAAAIAYLPEGDADENERRMTEAFTAVKTGQVTQAVRDSVYDGDKAIHTGDFMGLIDGKIRIVTRLLDACLNDLVEAMLEDGGELVTLFYGEGITEGDAELAADIIREAHPDIDVELMDGGQPLYHYMLSLS